MEPLERLLNLVGLLLETRTPLTFEQIRETLEPYRQEKVDSAKRMFERDKDILREYGVPLQLVDTDAWGTEQGYVIPKDAYYLPEIAFTPEELAALFVAAQGVRNDTPAEEAVPEAHGAARRGACWPGWRADRSPPARTPGGPWSWRSPRPRRIVAGFGSDTGRPRASRIGARRRRVRRRCSEPGTGTWWGSIASATSARSFRLSRFTSEI